MNYFRAASERKSEAETFSDLLDEEWSTNKWNAKSESGTCKYPTLGTLTYSNSSNDSAVIVNIGTIRLKGSAESVMKALEKAREAFDNVG